MLPDFLKKYEKELEKYKLDSIHIDPIPVKNGSVPITASKFLGIPYLPKGEKYPLDTDGKPMLMWAQINFKDLPNNNLYPKNGVLQFFVSADKWYNMKDYKVVFYPEITDNFNTDFSFLTPDLYQECPIECEHKLEFKKIMDRGNVQDIHFKGSPFYMINSCDFQKTLSKENQKKMDDIFNASGSKIGGYAHFTQDDPRTNSKCIFYNPEFRELKDDVLLLQIDSINKTTDKIMIGDIGVAHFFIDPEDLKSRNFEKSWFYWDCC